MQRIKRSPIWKISTESLKELIDKNETISGVMRYFGLYNKGNSSVTLKKRLNEEGIDYSKFGSNWGKGKFSKSIPLNEILIENCSINRANVKRRLLKEGLLENKCYICNLEPNWNGQKLVMVLDHKNGICDDNRINNLRLLCPNCNSQTSTFAGKNKKRKIYFCKLCGNKKRKNSKVCIKCSKFYFAENRKKVEWPTKEELLKLIWEKPTTQIAKDYGVSDVAVGKWCKKYNIDKPCRGYWASKTKK